MDKPVHLDLQSDDMIGATLKSVHALCFAPHDEPGPAIRSAISLEFPKARLTLRAMSDDDSIVVGHDKLSKIQAEETKPGEGPQDWRVEDISASPYFSRFIGTSLRNWWVLCNDAGYPDGFMLAFKAESGVCFVVMASSIHVQLVEGEQFS